MPSVPTQTHVEKWLIKQGYSKTSTLPLQYSKATITLTLSRFAITAAAGASGPVDPLILAALTTAAHDYIPITLW